MKTIQIKAAKIKEGMITSLPYIVALVKKVEKISDTSIRIYFGSDNKIFYKNEKINILI